MASTVGGAPLALLVALCANLAAGGAQVALPPVSDTPADLQLRLAFAPEFAQRTGWVTEFRCAAGRASRLLEPVLGRRLRVRDQVLWRAPSNRDDLYALRSQLVATVKHGDADLVVGLIPIATEGAAGGTRFIEDGLASYSHGYLVLRVGSELCETGSLLAHEIAHVFGGVHRAGPGNLMDPRAPGERLDELNLALLMHRNRLVRQQDPPLRGEQLRRMWRLAQADLSAAETWLQVGVLAAEMAQPEPACRYYERALAIRPALRLAWVNLGHARMQLGHFDGAENAYLKAIELAPADGLLHNNLAVVYLSTGRPTLAAEALERALTLGYEVAQPLRHAVAAAVVGAKYPS